MRLAVLLGVLVSANAQILDLARTLDLASSTAKAASVLVLPQDASTLRLVYPKCPLADAHNLTPPQLSSVQVYLGQGARHSPDPLAVHPVRSEADDCRDVFDVPLEAQSAPNTTLTIRETYVHPSTPLPARVSQSSFDNFLVFNDNIYGPFSHYSIKNARARIRLPSSRFDILQNSSEYSLSSSTLVFNDTDYTPSTKTIAARYHAPESARSFATAERIATISHWSAFVQFTDTLDLHNIGPALDAQFSRIAHQIATLPRDPSARAPSNPPPHTITTFGFRIPSESTNIEYYDAVGKVSTMRLRSTSKVSTNVELSPRFPLNGGNKFYFSLSHRQPLSSVARRLPSAAVPTYLARIPVSIVSSIIGESAPSQQTSLMINLPRGATNINVSVQGDGDAGFVCQKYEQQEQQQDTQQKDCSIEFVKTNVVLDIFGKRQSVLVNGSEKLTNQSVLVEYSLPLSAWVQQPLMIGLLFIAGYLVVYLVKRVNSSEGSISI